RPPSPTLFPYTTLFRSAQATADSAVPAERRRLADRRNAAAVLPVGSWSGVERRIRSDRRGGAERRPEFAGQAEWQAAAGWRAAGDRKSTRLNSSHEWIS